MATRWRSRAGQPKRCLGREEKHKTLISMSLGLLLAGVGMDTVSGQLRMTFGSNDLLRGINFLVAVIGLFGISEILLTMEERLALRGHAAKISLRVALSVWKDLPKYWVTLLRSSFIGCWLGITPGGAIAASFMGYNLAKRFSKDPESFGKGRIEGVFAPETAAHASGTAALLPMLALGIPGSGTAAILLGGLMVWGLNPGPLLFVEHKDFVWGLIASMYLGNVVGLVLVLTTVPIFASILRVPFAAVAPMLGAVPVGFSSSSTNVGYTVGAGVEGVIGGNWTAKLEYLYVDLGKMSGSFLTTIPALGGGFLTSNYSSRITDNVLRVGVNYKFGGPVVAKY